MWTLCPKQNPGPTETDSRRLSSGKVSRLPHQLGDNSLSRFGRVASDKRDQPAWTILVLISASRDTIPQLVSFSGRWTVLISAASKINVLQESN